MLVAPRVANVTQRSLSTLATGAQMRNSDSASFEVVVPSSIGEDGEA